MKINFNQKAIIVNSDGKILVVRGATTTWDLPGGPVVLPTLHSVSLREAVKAQTGVEIWDFQVIGIETSFDPDTDTYHVFAGHAVTVSALTQVQLGGGMTEFSWVKIKDFKNLTVPLYVLEFVTKAANSQ